MVAINTALTDIVRADRGESGDDEDDDEDDWPGLYHPAEYVLQTWQEKRSHGTLPEPGGLNDQDWRLVYHDWPLMNARYNRLMRQLYPDDGTPGQRPVQLPVTAKGFGELLE